MSLFKQLIVSVLCVCGGLAAEPEAVYLSWVDDPTETMVIHWMDEAAAGSWVYSQKVGGGEWVKTEGKVRVVEGSQMKIHVVELGGLSQDTAYQFRVGEESQSYEFQTLSKDKPLKFVVGGDAYYKRDLFEKMNKEVARQNPDFVVMGGDIAYTVGGGRGIFKGREWEVGRWKAFFKEWQKSLVKSNGQLIPIIPVVGNHDVGRKGSGKQVMFYTVFSFPEEGKAYQVVDIGKDFSLFLLDTGHTASIEGEQTDFLKKALEERKDRKVKIAGYHIAAFPSFYPYEKTACVKIRENWVTLFEKYGVCVAFEHHNHTYKRTHPLREEKIDPKGIIYLGDGSWGVPPRIPLRPGVMWYLAETRSENAYFLVSVDKGQVRIEPRRNNGKLVEPVITIVPSKN
jgi:hypothetical protein